MKEQKLNIEKTLIDPKESKGQIDCLVKFCPKHLSKKKAEIIYLKYLVAWASLSDHIFDQYENEIENPVNFDLIIDNEQHKRAIQEQVDKWTKKISKKLWKLEGKI